MMRLHVRMSGHSGHKYVCVCVARRVCLRTCTYIWSVLLFVALDACVFSESLCLFHPFPFFCCDGIAVVPFGDLVMQSIGPGGRWFAPRKLLFRPSSRTSRVLVAEHPSVRLPWQDTSLTQKEPVVFDSGSDGNWIACLLLLVVVMF